MSDPLKRLVTMYRTPLCTVTNHPDDSTTVILWKHLRALLDAVEALDEGLSRIIECHPNWEASELKIGAKQAQAKARAACGEKTEPRDSAECRLGKSCFQLMPDAEECTCGFKGKKL